MFFAHTSYGYLGKIDAKGAAKRRRLYAHHSSKSRISVALLQCKFLASRVESQLLGNLRFTVPFKKSSYWQLWQLAWPLILSNLCVPLAGLIDTALLGHLDSNHYLSAAAIAASLCTLVLASFNFLRMASTGLSAQALSQSPDAASRFLLQGLIIALLLGLSIAALSPIISQLGLSIMGIKAPLLALAQQYAGIRLLAAPAVFMNFVFIGFVIGQQHSKPALLILLVSTSVNIIADVYFIYCLGLNSQGAAWASVLGDYSGLACAFIICRRYLSWPCLHVFSGFRRYLSINSDLFIRSLCLLGTFSAFNALSENLGPHTVAANAILLQLILLQSYILDGLANATEAKIGQFYLQKTPLQRFLNSSFLLSLAAAVILLLAFSAAYPLLPAIFTNQALVITQVNKNLWFVLLMPIIAFPAYWLDGVAVGLAASKAMRNASLAASLLVFVPFVLVLMHFWPSNMSLWLCFVAFTMSRWLFLALFLQHSAFTFMPRPVLSA